MERSNKSKCHVEISQAVVDGLNNSEEWAFNIVYDKCFSKVYQFCRYFLGDEAAAKAVVHDVFIDAMEFRKFIDPSHVQGWLNQVSRHVCINYVKKASRHKAVIRPIPDNVDLDTFYSPQVDMMLEKMMGDVGEAVQQLPEQDQVIVKLVYLDGYTGKEVSQLTGISHATVRKRLSRAIIRLREKVLPNTGLSIIFLIFHWICGQIIK